MSDSAFGARLGEAARAVARGRYSFDRMVASFEQLYLNELNRRRHLSVTNPRLAASS